MQSYVLHLELRRWRDMGRRASLWWRDDDARAPSPALDRLLAIAAAAEVPLTLAVIPDGDMSALAARLGQVTGVQVAQHGADHQNRREGRVAGEFPPEWPRVRLVTALLAGRRKLAGLPGALPVFVPPWNDVHPELESALSDAGYLGWSAAGERRRRGALSRVDIHLDLLRWRGGARFRGPRKFLRELAAELRARRLAEAWQEPIGLLTHHLDHDEEAWAFLAQFLAWSRDNQPFLWRALPDLMRPPSLIAAAE
jgi:hypothetical protein